MTDKVQLIKEEIERLKHTDIAYDRSRFILLLQIEDFIDSLPKEPASEDLGEYINELSKQVPKVSFAKLSRIAVRVANWQKEKDSILPKVYNRENLDDFSYQTAYDLSNDWAKEAPTWRDVEIACKLGAEWQKQQMIKDAVECTVRQCEVDCIKLDGVEILSDGLMLDDSKYKVGDKVKVIVVKTE